MSFRDRYPQVIMNDDLDTFKVILLSDSDPSRSIKISSSDPLDHHRLSVTPLFLAAKYGNVRMVELLLDKLNKPQDLDVPCDESLADIRQRLGFTSLLNDHHITAVNIAAIYGRSDIVNMLCKAGADHRVKDACRRDAFSNACLHGNIETVFTLFKYISIPADFFSEDLCGQNAFVLACRTGDAELVENLRGLDAPIDCYGCLSAVWKATSLGDVSMPALLLKSGGSVLNRTEPLVLPTAKRRVEALQVLKHFGLTLDDHHSDGGTLLHVAAEFENGSAVLEYLVCELEHFIDKKNSYCYTPLCVAVEKRLSASVRVLLKAKCNPNIPESPRRTPLIIAIDNLDVEIVEMLISGGASINARDIFERTPVMHAVMAKLGTEEICCICKIISLLICAGCDTSVRDCEGNTLLLLAIKRRSLALVDKVLTLTGTSNTNAVNKAGKSALHLSVGGGDVEVTKLLIKGGFDVTVTDAEGETALKKLGSYRVLKQVLDNVHRQQVSTRNLRALCRLLVLAGAHLPHGYPIEVGRLEKYYLSLMPLSLEELCRLVVRERLQLVAGPSLLVTGGSGILTDAIDQLLINGICLPVQIKGFLKFDDL